jgi:hypothetical protein
MLTIFEEIRVVETALKGICRNERLRLEDFVVERERERQCL